MHYDAEWTEEWPTKTGYYWFFGHRSRSWQEKHQSEPELNIVSVKGRKDGSAFYSCNGEMLWKSEAGDGLWTPVMMPNLPNKGDD